MEDEIKREVEDCVYLVSGGFSIWLKAYLKLQIQHKTHAHLTHTIGFGCVRGKDVFIRDYGDSILLDNTRGH